MNTTTRHDASLREARLSLEQRRAQHAWNCVKDGAQEDYVRVAKALPQLIMNSGLMQTLAFLHQKKGAHEVVAGHLRAWLQECLGQAKGDPGFEAMMKTLLHSESQQFQRYTVEALAWLKWLRQLASAQKRKQQAEE